MKKIAVSCAVLLVIVMSALVAAQAPKTVPRDVSGVVIGVFTFEQWGSEWYELYTIGDAAGTIQHLGLSKMHTKHTPQPDGTLADGTFTIGAANGDEIHGVYEGLAYQTSDTYLDFMGKATFVITGGTGRFAHATGTLDATFTETFEDYTYALAHTCWRLSGTVNY